MSGRLKGKRALITGSGSGIGRGCAAIFVREGAAVLAADIDAGALASLAAEHGGIATFTADLTDPAQVKALAAHAERLGGTDILINAAAVADFRWIGEMDYQAHWRRTLTGELDTVFLMCQAIWPQMIARGGGAVVNLASANAYVALKHSPALAHSAGKGGVLAMTRQLAMEGGPHGIRVNSISPGMIVTPATAPVLARPELLASVKDKLMVGRLGRPEDVAWGAVYLCSDEAAYVTGTDLSIDGGARAW